MKQRFLWTGLGVAVLAAAVAISTVVLVKSNASALPKSIREQVTSTLIVPQGKAVTLDRASATYDSQLKVLVYRVNAYGAQVTISEQPTPDSFIDVPQVFDKIANGMQEYAKFDTDIGTVHLGRPTQIDHKQTAIMNSKGTLLFASAERDLSQDQWRQLFANMVTIK